MSENNILYMPCDQNPLMLYIEYPHTLTHKLLWSLFQLLELLNNSLRVLFTWSHVATVTRFLTCHVNNNYTYIVLLWIWCIELWKVSIFSFGINFRSKLLHMEKINVLLLAVVALSSERLSKTLIGTNLPWP